jgi:hypothetical protein
MLSFGKWLLLGALVIIIVVFSVNPQSARFAQDLSFQDVLAALGGIFIIVLLVERATEIVITIWRQAKGDQLKKELAVLETSSKAAAAADKAKELAEYQAETKGYSLLVGFTLSVIVCSAGIGLLGEIIDSRQGSEQFFRGVDIILTSGLIAGGSDAFHQFVRALETFFTKSKENMEKPK